MGWEPVYKAMFIGDTMNFLRCVFKRAGMPARIDWGTPINFYQMMRMSAYGEENGGALVVSQKTEDYNTFVWTVTEAGFKFMREHGWTEGEEEPARPQLPHPVFKDGEVHHPPMPKIAGAPVGIIFKLDRKRRVHEMYPLDAPEKIREGFMDGSNTVMVINGELYASSFEDLIGSDVDILFQEIEF